MRVLMLSKALVVGAYQRKLELLAEQPSIELTCVVPPAWGGQRLERAHLRGYRLLVRPIRFNGSFHLFYFPGLPRLLRELRPEVVHVDEEPYNLATFLATRQALAAGARPLFFTWQNLPQRYPPPFAWMERYVLGHARHAIAGNREAVDVLRRKGYTGPVALIPQFGVDPEIFKPVERARSEAATDGELMIGYAGRLVEEKGLLVLLDALAGLQRGWRLQLLVSGPPWETLWARARELGIDGRVSATTVPSGEMPARLAELDLLVLPSLTRKNWKEQFGRVLVEAMACGVPVVGSSSGEIPWVIGDAGLIVPEGDHLALRAALARLAADPILRADLAGRGRARVLDHFTQDRIARDTAAVYREIENLV